MRRVQSGCDESMSTAPGRSRLRFGAEPRPSGSGGHRTKLWGQNTSIFLGLKRRRFPVILAIIPDWSGYDAPGRAKRVSMAHIQLPEGLPGITSGFAFRPETATPMRELAEVLLRGPSTLSSGEREMIATFVSTQNECYFCQTSHRAAAAHHLGGNYALVDEVRFDYRNADVSEKMKALLT